MNLHNVLAAAAASVARRDFHAFADELESNAVPPALVAIVRAHADVADGNSPDVPEWVGLTLAEWSSYLAAGGDPDDEDEAADWWRATYDV